MGTDPVMVKNILYFLPVKYCDLLEGYQPLFWHFHFINVLESAFLDAQFGDKKASVSLILRILQAIK